MLAAQFDPANCESAPMDVPTVPMSLNQGVTNPGYSGYTLNGMFDHASSKAQFAPARVLAPLLSVPAPLFGGVALASPSQPLR